MSDTEKHINCRTFLETDEGRFVSVSHLQKTDDPELILQTIGPIKRAINTRSTALARSSDETALWRGWMRSSQKTSTPTGLRRSRRTSSTSRTEA